MAKFDNPFVSEATPRMGNALTRTIGALILKALGWKMTGQLPNEKKVIIIGAPHTSNWDFILAMGAMLSVGLKFSWMMKKEAFWGPLGALWKVMNGVPVDRHSKNDITQQMADWFKANDNVWLGMTPEGTRSKVSTFKKGYLRIAYAAGVPIFVVGINAPTKEIVFDKLFPLTFDTDTDNRKVKAHFDKSFTGVNPKLG